MNITSQTNKMSSSNTKSNMFYLWWLNKHTKKRFCAGRAFYSEGNGDYSVLINLLETSSKDGVKEEMFLRPIQVKEDNVYYRLEKVVRKGTKSHRFCIGEAFQNANTEGDIHIFIEPLTNAGKVLVLSLAEKTEQVAAA
ncbi:MAG: hypothetical protein ACLGHN_08150 [Bacteriovoracia bacterium]